MRSRIRTARHPLRSFLSIGCAVVTFGLCSVSSSAHAEWSAIAEQKVSYTSNAIQFSSARRLQFSDDPSLPTGIPLGNPEDVIWEPSLEVMKILHPSLGRTELSVKGHGFIFTNNPIFTHGDYRAQVRQYLGSATSVLLRYRYIPNLFLGPNIERQTGERFIEGERVTTSKWRMEIERKFTSRLMATFIGRYGLRTYNQPFSERDTRFYTIGPRIFYRVLPRVGAYVTALYERGKADGAEETQFNDDVSYRLYHLSGGVEITILPRWLLSLAYTYQRKNFTSDLPEDTHFGRRDHLHQGLAELGYQATARALFTLGLQRTQRTSSNAFRDFNDTILSLGAQYRF